MIFLRALSLTAVLLAFVGLGSAASAQGFDLFHRQAQQAAPPADIPGATEDDAGGAPELVLRINRLEEQLRQANGRIEELENAEHRLEDQLQKFRQDVEFRFGERSGQPQPPAPTASAAAAPEAVIEGSAAAKPKKSDAFDPDAAPNAPGAPRPLGTTAPSAPLVRPAPPAGTPLELGKGPASAPPPPTATGPLITGSGVAMLDAPREQFNTALQAFQTGQYQQAEDGFKAFMAANSGHRLTPDAIFYIGETYFQRSRPREAAEQYLKVTTDYAKSPRAPESMVRLGQTLAALGNGEQACATFTEFGKRYPTATPSIKRLADREMAKDHCGG
ncbi:MAG: tol-pal system protein YbgF [Hyphomicrobiales bacterium]|nr:tol-pal system protein YbgF [Hyphomicrobiales bacterium]